MEAGLGSAYFPTYRTAFNLTFTPFGLIAQASKHLPGAKYVYFAFADVPSQLGMDGPSHVTTGNVYCEDYAGYLDGSLQSACINKSESQELDRRPLE